MCPYSGIAYLNYLMGYNLLFEHAHTYGTWGYSFALTLVLVFLRLQRVFSSLVIRSPLDAV